MAEEQIPEATPNDSPAPDGAGNVALNIQDLSAVVQAIDIAVQRGAYRGPEMSQVGAIYDRVSTFVANVQAQTGSRKTS